MELLCFILKGMVSKILCSAPIIKILHNTFLTYVVPYNVTYFFDSGGYISNLGYKTVIIYDIVFHSRLPLNCHQILSNRDVEST